MDINEHEILLNITPLTQNKATWNRSFIAALHFTVTVGRLSSTMTITHTLFKMSVN